MNDTLYMNGGSYSIGESPFKEAFTHGNRVFYGGSEARVTDRKWNAIISLNERHKRESIVDIKVPDFGVTRIFNLHCFNFDAPFLSKDEWLKLINELPSGEIAVCCYGGKGRTGTALAVLRALLTGDLSDPILTIRKSYRKEAVESDKQIDYISSITGIESVAKAEHFGNYLYDADFWHNY